MILPKKILCLSMVSTLSLFPLTLMAEEIAQEEVQISSESLILNETEIIKKELPKNHTYVSVNNAKLRTSSDPESEIKKYLNQDQEVKVLKKSGDWYYVSVEDEIDGWIFSSQINVHLLSDDIPIVKDPLDSKREEVVNYALQFIGNPYVYGGTSLTNGVDCSSYTQQILAKVGIKLERVSRSQYAKNGIKVSKQDLKKGDLVFYGYDNYIDHVAIYIGDGKIAHASSPKTGITVSKLQFSNKPIVGIKRVIL